MKLKKNSSNWMETCIITLFEIFIFCPKIQLWFPEKNCRIVLGENSWKCCGFGLFSCWQLWFHEKNCNVLSKLIFRQKFDFSNSVQEIMDDSITAISSVNIITHISWIMHETQMIFLLAWKDVRPRPICVLPHFIKHVIIQCHLLDAAVLRSYWPRPGLIQLLGTKEALIKEKKAQ